MYTFVLLTVSHHVWDVPNLLFALVEILRGISLHIQAKIQHPGEYYGFYTTPYQWHWMSTNPHFKSTLGQWNTLWKYLEKPIINDASKGSVCSGMRVIFGGLWNDLVHACWHELGCFDYYVNKCNEIVM